MPCSSPTILSHHLSCHWLDYSLPLRLSVFSIPKLEIGAFKHDNSVAKCQSICKCCLWFLFIGWSLLIYPSIFGISILRGRHLCSWPLLTLLLHVSISLCHLEGYFECWQCHMWAYFHHGLKCSEWFGSRYLRYGWQVTLLMFILCEWICFWALLYKYRDVVLKIISLIYKQLTMSSPIPSCLTIHIPAHSAPVGGSSADKENTPLIFRSPPRHLSDIFQGKVTTIMTYITCLTQVSFTDSPVKLSPLKAGSMILLGSVCGTLRHHFPVLMIFY